LDYEDFLQMILPVDHSKLRSAIVIRDISYLHRD